MDGSNVSTWEPKSGVGPGGFEPPPHSGVVVQLGGQPLPTAPSGTDAEASGWLGASGTSGNGASGWLDASGTADGPPVDAPDATVDPERTTGSGEETSAPLERDEDADPGVTVPVEHPRAKANI